MHRQNVKSGPLFFSKGIYFLLFYDKEITILDQFIYPPPPQTQMNIFAGVYTVPRSAAENSSRTAAAAAAAGNS